MKRVCLLLSLFCFVTINAFGQGSSVYIGAQTGINLSKFKFTEGLKDLYPVSSSSLGINGGFDLGLELQGWTLATGIHYAQKGSNYETDNFEDEFGTGFYGAKERLHYVSIPILLGYREYLGNKVALTVNVGPSLNFGLGGNIDETIEYFGSDEVETSNFKVAYGSGVNEDYKGIQVGFQISPGILYKINDRSKLHFRVTWDMELSDSFNPRYKQANDFFDRNSGDQFNRSAFFTVGYEYHLPFGDKY